MKRFNLPLSVASRSSLGQLTLLFLRSLTRANIPNVFLETWVTSLKGLLYKENIFFCKTTLSNSFDTTLKDFAL